MSPTDNRATILRFYDAMNTGDDAQIDEAVAEVFDPDVTLHTSLPTQATGAAGIKERLAALHRAFPDFHLVVSDAIAEGDKLVTRNTITGTHEGNEFGFEPTGRSFEIDEIMLYRFENGRVVEIHGVVDIYSQLRQLELLPA